MIEELKKTTQKPNTNVIGFFSVKITNIWYNEYVTINFVGDFYEYKYK